MYISITTLPTYFLLGWWNISQKLIDPVTSRLLTRYFKRSKQIKIISYHTLCFPHFALSVTYAPRPRCLGIYWIPEPNSNKPDLKQILSSIFICSTRQLTLLCCCKMSGYVGHKEGLVSTVIPYWGKLRHKLSVYAFFCFIEHVLNLGICGEKNICEWSNILVENSWCCNTFSVF